MNRLVYHDVYHDCDLPSTNHLPRYGSNRQVIARWKCPECGQLWRYETEFMAHGEFYWKRSGPPSRRWKRREARRLAALEAG